MDAYTQSNTCVTLGEMQVHRARWLAILSTGALMGCDPILSIDGAFFPAWLMCLVVAAALLTITRLIVRRAGIEPFIGPKITVYFRVYLAWTLALWLGFFRT